MRVLLPALLITIAVTAHAEDLERGWGFSATERTITGQHPLAGGGELRTRRSSGIFFTYDAALPFNGSSYECLSSFYMAASDPHGHGHGQCYGIDPEGDIWWAQLRGGRDYGTWTFLDGTGRYLGVKGGGTWDTRATAGPKKYITTWKGQWQLARQ